jgi:L-arabinose isomerase
MAGGPHHTSFSQALQPSHLSEFAEMAGVELLAIGDQTTVSDFKNAMRWNHVYYRLSEGL